MKRIEPECFIFNIKNQCENSNYNTRYFDLIDLSDILKSVAMCKEKTIAIFLIKPQSTTLAERMEARLTNQLK